MELDVVVHHDSDTRSFWAEVVQLPGCFAAGRTKEELYQALAEAVALYLDGEDRAEMISSDRVEAVERYRISEDNKLIPT